MWSLLLGGLEKAVIRSQLFFGGWISFFWSFLCHLRTAHKVNPQGNDKLLLLEGGNVSGSPAVSV